MGSPCVAGAFPSRDAEVNRLWQMCVSISERRFARVPMRERHRMLRSLRRRWLFLDTLRTSSASSSARRHTPQREARGFWGAPGGRWVVGITLARWLQLVVAGPRDLRGPLLPPFSTPLLSFQLVIVVPLSRVLPSLIRPSCMDNQHSLVFENKPWLCILRFKFQKSRVVPFSSEFLLVEP